MDPTIHNEHFDIESNVPEFPEELDPETFRNAILAKRKLQAFCALKESSPNFDKTLNESQENYKADISMDKTKLMDEIELLKKMDQLQSTSTNSEEKLKRRSRSKSSERGFVFRKREKKPRNYRRSDSSRRSPSPIQTRVKEKSKSLERKLKYPKNWDEFNRDKWTFDKLLGKHLQSSVKKPNFSNDIHKHLSLETPAEIIKPFYCKNDKGEEILVPYQFLRYTLAKPQIAYNVNLRRIKEQYLTRQQVLKRTPTKFKEILDRFLSKNVKTKFRTAEPIGQRNWYQKNWKDDSKVLETSIGLSFLQTYSDDEYEEEELIPDTSHFVKKEESKKRKETINFIDPEEFDLGNEETSIGMEAKFDNELNFETIPIGEEGIKTPEMRESIDKLVDGEEEEQIISDRRKGDEKLKRKEEKAKKRKEKERRNSEKSKENKGKTLDKERRDDKSLKKKEKTSKNEENERTSSRMEEDSRTPENSTPKKPFKTEIISIEEIRTTPQISIDELPKIEETSWTPERNIDRIMNEISIESSRKSSEIHSQNEWDETPENSDSEQEETKKIRKRKRKNEDDDSDSNTSTDTKSSKKRKKKLEKKRLKEKEKKARKMKEKMKAEKLKLKEKKKKKRKEREREKKILKKLKKEIEHNLELVEIEEIENLNKEKVEENEPIRVKVEKEENRERIARPPGDLRNFLDKKCGKMKNSQEREHVHSKIEEKTVCTKDDKDNQTKVINPIEMTKNEEIISVSSKINVCNTEIKNELNKLKDESICTNTPDTDEYHSNWESDDGILPPKKQDRSWGSDEEMFDRSFSKKHPMDNPFSDSLLLEIPLNIKKFSRRESEKKPTKKRSRTRSPERFDIDNEIKLLEKERENLSKERIQLEIEKLRIKELERKNSLDEIELMSEVEMFLCHENAKKKGSRWDLREDHVDSSTSKEKIDQIDDKSFQSTKSTDGVASMSNSPEISSTKSPTPNVLENAYEEFLKAVSADESKEPIIISSTDCENVDLPTNELKTVEILENERSKIISTTDPRVLQEILLPGEQPSIDYQIPIPVPVPSPKIETLPQNIVSNQTTLIQSEQFDLEPNSEPTEESQDIESEDAKKTFSFSSLVLPSKKTLLVEKSNWKLDEDSDDEIPPINRTFEEEQPKKEEEKIEIKSKIVEKSKRKRSPIEHKDKRKDEERRKTETKRKDDEVRRRDKRRRSTSRGKSSPRRRRGASPSHRRYRTPPRRQEASRRTRSPQRRRRSYSPPPPKTSASRRRSPSPRSRSPRGYHNRRSKSPGHHSPLDGLKRSVADSTISDDLLPQPYMECSDSPLTRGRLTMSPKRPSLDERINQALGIQEPVQQCWKGMEEYDSSIYHAYQHETSISCGNSKVLQIGNILEVVPTEDLPPPAPVQPPPGAKIVQVGNMLQIVPTEIIDTPPPPPPHAVDTSMCDEAYMQPYVLQPQQQLLQLPPPPPPPPVDNKLAEKARKRKEKEERKMEKERKRKEKEKKKKIKLKISTEEMIKRALELEGFLDTDNQDAATMVVPEIISETPGLDPSKSILTNSTSRYQDSNKTEKRKSVQFADGVRPGEGTSPSGGEELSSPPPQQSEVVESSKIKKFRKSETTKKRKRKIKVKVIKRRVPSPDSDEEYENLAPPSPPPGSPPPHVFPPRVKVHTLNNIPQHYLAAYGVTAPQQQATHLDYQNVYRAPPPPPPVAHVMGQHYGRGTAPPPPPHVHSSNTVPHHQSYGSF